MRFVYRRLWLPFYRRWAQRQVRRVRRWDFAGLRLTIPPAVFHPGIYFSTPIFISFLQKIDFQGKNTLDVGAGSGVLALFASQKGAASTAIDINPAAVETTRANAAANDLALTLLESDLFDAVPPQIFDFILINPPYYPRSPRSAAEKAFFAGENLEYFEKLFAQLPGYIGTESRVYLVLSEDCRLDQIQNIAASHRFGLDSVFEQKKWGEHFFVFQASPIEFTKGESPQDQTH